MGIFYKRRRNFTRKVSDFLPFSSNEYSKHYKFECREDEYHNGILDRIHLHVYFDGLEIGRVYCNRDGSAEFELKYGLSKDSISNDAIVWIQNYCGNYVELVIQQWKAYHPKEILRDSKYLYSASKIKRGGRNKKRK